MSTAEKAENRPPEPAPDSAPREKLDSVIAYARGRTYEIPMSVAQQYEISDTHDMSDEDEVGGRDQRLIGGRLQYHVGWANGSYMWITDGQWYRGFHWHPNVNHPGAFDMENY